MSIFNRHTAYERLVTEHVDGLLDEAGEAKLRQHLAICASCAVEVHEQQAVRTLLTAQPMVAAPRSFTLPYAPRQVTADDSRVAGWLRGMQVATAALVLVLVTLVLATLVGVNVVDPTGDASPSSDAQALSAALEQADMLEKAGAEGIPVPKTDGAAPPVARAPESEFSTSAPSGFAPEGVTPEGLIPEGGVGGGLFEDGETPMLAAPPTELLFAPVADNDRSALKWALLAASAITAVLALSVVTVTWRVRRPI